METSIETNKVLFEAKRPDIIITGLGITMMALGTLMLFLDFTGLYSMMLASLSASDSSHNSNLYNNFTELAYLFISGLLAVIFLVGSLSAQRIYGQTKKALYMAIFLVFTFCSVFASVPNIAKAMGAIENALINSFNDMTAQIQKRVSVTSTHMSHIVGASDYLLTSYEDKLEEEAFSGEGPIFGSYLKQKNLLLPFVKTNQQKLSALKELERELGSLPDEALAERKQILKLLAVLVNELNSTTYWNNQTDFYQDIRNQYVKDVVVAPGIYGTRKKDMAFVANAENVLAAIANMPKAEALELPAIDKNAHRKYINTVIGLFFDGAFEEVPGDIYGAFFISAVFSVLMMVMNQMLFALTATERKFANMKTVADFDSEQVKHVISFAKFADGNNLVKSLSRAILIHSEDDDEKIVFKLSKMLDDDASLRSVFQVFEGFKLVVPASTPLRELLKIHTQHTNQGDYYKMEKSTYHEILKAVYQFEASKNVAFNEGSKPETEDPQLHAVAA